MVWEFDELLRGGSLRVTQPRLAVLTAVGSHPHADTDSIIAAVRERLPGVSHQAVHGSANTPTDAAVLRKVQPFGLVARYQSRVGDNHHHVVCRSCGRVDDIDRAVGNAPCMTPCMPPSDDHDFAIDETWSSIGACAPTVRPRSKPRSTLHAKQDRQPRKD